jgi:hypothetical protein
MSMVAKVSLLVCAWMQAASPALTAGMIAAEEDDTGQGMACTDSMVTEPYYDAFDIIPASSSSDARCEAPQMPISI